MKCNKLMQPGLPEIFFNHGHWQAMTQGFSLLDNVIASLDEALAATGLGMQSTITFLLHAWESGYLDLFLSTTHC